MPLFWLPRPEEDRRGVSRFPWVIASKLTFQRRSEQEREVATRPRWLPLSSIAFLERASTSSCAGVLAAGLRFCVSWLEEQILWQLLLGNSSDGIVLACGSTSERASGPAPQFGFRSWPRSSSTAFHASPTRPRKPCARLQTSDRIVLPFHSGSIRLVERKLPWE